MPTGTAVPVDRCALLRIEGFRFYFFSREGNEPPHVHVGKGDGKPSSGCCRWSSSRGLTKAELRRIYELTQEQAQDFLQRWQEHFPR